MKIKKKELNKQEEYIFCAGDGDVTQLNIFCSNPKEVLLKKIKFIEKKKTILYV